jgi:hypothetical protein
MRLAIGTDANGQILILRLGKGQGIRSRTGTGEHVPVWDNDITVWAASLALDGLAMRAAGEERTIADPTTSVFLAAERSGDEADPGYLSATVVQPAIGRAFDLAADDLVALVSSALAANLPDS